MLSNLFAFSIKNILYYELKYIKQKPCRISLVGLNKYDIKTYLSEVEKASNVAYIISIYLSSSFMKSHFKIRDKPCQMEIKSKIRFKNTEHCPVCRCSLT